PWQRIRYSGSYIGSNAGGPINAFGAYIIGGTLTNLGRTLSEVSPLPSNTNAVRWATGRLTVGEMSYVKIALRLTAAIPAGGLINNSEVFGGDASADIAGKGKDNTWRYHVPSVAYTNSNLMMLKSVVGICAGAGCDPGSTSNPTSISIGTSTIRYRMSYLNSSAAAQTNVQIIDTLPAQTTAAGNVYIISGSDVRPTNPVISANAAAVGAPRGALPGLTAIGGGSVVNFGTILSMSPGTGGSFEVDIEVQGVAVGDVVSNAAKLLSVQVPLGVTSISSMVANDAPKLDISKTVTPNTAAPGDVVNYTITITNSGYLALVAGDLTSVEDFLPSLGTPNNATTRFVRTGAATITTLNNPAAGAVALAPTETVLVPPNVIDVPYNTQNREKITWTGILGGNQINVGGNITFSFPVTIGSNIPASATGYVNDAKVTYTTTDVKGNNVTISSATLNTAPVTITSPLAITKTIDCIYSPDHSSCNAYDNSGSIPSGAKVRYKISYSNTGGTAHSNVYVCDQLTSTDAGLTSTISQPIIAPTPNNPYADVPNIGVPAQITGGSAEATACGFSGANTFAYPKIASLAGSATGELYIDIYSNSPVSAVLDNTAKMVSTEAPSGVQSMVTAGVRDEAKLDVTKTTSTPNIVPSGTATYTITISNNGSNVATGIKVYDELPFTGTANDPTLRFNYAATNAVTAPITAVVPTISNPPSLLSYASNTNQQEALWDFTGQTLDIGYSFTIEYTATAGSGLIANGTTQYKNDVQVEYKSGTNTFFAGATNTAPVVIPTNLLITKTIDCVYDAAGTSCYAYNDSGLIPVAGKLRYKIHYENTGATNQSNVYICDQLPTQIAGFTSVSTPAIAPTPTGVFADTPALGARSNPANAACTGLAGTTFSYPVIATLAAGATGDIYFDLQTNSVANDALSNTAMIVSTQAPAGEQSTVAATAIDVPQLSVTKTTTTPNRSAGELADFKIEVTNTGSADTTALRIYDFLPFDGIVDDATKRFVFTVASSTYVGTGFAAAITTHNTSLPPTTSPFSSNPNQQQVYWDFSGFALTAGSTVSIQFTATVGSNMTSAAYVNNARAEFDSASGSGSSSANAAVTVAPTGADISGKVFEDANFSGNPDTGEDWTGGMTVFVNLLQSGAVVQSKTVNVGTGVFSFTGVSAGDYTIVVTDTAVNTAAVIPSTWAATSTTSATRNVTMNTLNIINQDFGLFHGSTISGTVFNDNGTGTGGIANDGIQNGGELGLGNVNVKATDNAGSTIHDQISTSGNGGYTLFIPHSANGTNIKIVETNTGGYISTGSNGVSLGNTAGTYDRTTDTTSFTFNSAISYSGVDFGDVLDSGLLTDGQQYALQGSVVFFPHIFIANTYGNVTFSTSNIATPAIAEWTDMLYEDSNCNAQIDSGEPAITTAVAVVTGQNYCLLMKQFVPLNAPVDARNLVTVQASFDYLNAAPAINNIYTRTDLTLVGKEGLTLVKIVDKSMALPGDTITYTITYSNPTSGLLDNLIINDITPAYTTFVSAACGALPANITVCDSTTVAPASGSTGSMQWIMTGTLAPASSGTVSYSVKLDP
ncbi:MAG: hypothetical protein R8L53_07815, partial [Mariprofundales bacterium]